MESKKAQLKKPYEKPRLIVRGSIETITLGGSYGAPLVPYPSR